MSSVIVEGLSGCAVVVHDRQDNGVGRASVQAKAVAKAETTTKKTRRIEYAPVDSPWGRIVSQLIHSIVRNTQS